MWPKLLSCILPINPSSRSYRGISLRFIWRLWVSFLHFDISPPPKKKWIFTEVWWGITFFCSSSNYSFLMNRFLASLTREQRTTFWIRFPFVFIRFVRVLGFFFYFVCLFYFKGYIFDRVGLFCLLRLRKSIVFSFMKFVYFICTF